jgi:formylglycine-generating enzyme required for sulfatase activity
MFQRTCIAALAAAAVQFSFTFATAEEPKASGGKETKVAGGEKQITNSIGMKLTLIPSGEFMMGSEESAEDAAAFFRKNYGEEYLTADYFVTEHPQHRVRITKPFYLGTYHVTRGQFRQFVQDTRFKTEAEKGDNLGVFDIDIDRDNVDPEAEKWKHNKNHFWDNTGFEQTDEHPVVNVSWNDAVAFCEWLSHKEGKIYRLPTEAEWEYACRAGTTTRYYIGDDPEALATVANVADGTLTAKYRNWKHTIKARDGYLFTSPVGQFKPNAFGLFDMHGNAWQWCADHGDGGYVGESMLVDPKGISTGDRRVIRGGSWLNGPNCCRSAKRSDTEPINRKSDIGFRVARTR